MTSGAVFPPSAGQGLPDAADGGDAAEHEEEAAGGSAAPDRRRAPHPGHAQIRLRPGQTAGGEREWCRRWYGVPVEEASG